MKSIATAVLLLAAILGSTLYVISRNSTSPSKTKKEQSKFAAFKFEETSHDFGIVQDGDTVEHTFNFANSGSATLLISDISTGCGCTAASWTKEPIPVNGVGHVKLQFSKHHDPGIHGKVAIIRANTKDPYTAIRIKANVQK